ncbi:MAG: hypothetical protein COA52_01750 [Hyphomicrobiales bacterium]|nr:hypothetical protein [Hyphomicrobiales bacterium]PCJ96441.1 MAG: hypothetical protein COA52_01750 [Hyphomicrobiales bacterium]
MCGEIDENILINQELLERFTTMSKLLGLEPSVNPAAAPKDLASSKGRADYMDQIFRLGLARALNDANAAEEDEAVDAMASQAIAFARLAGFLAAQLPPDADLFRSVIEAVSAGYSETNGLEKTFHDKQAHAHGHHHH